MKKIMFNDKYGLTDAVLQGRKTMTRRIIRNLSDFDPRLDWINWGNNDNEKASIAIFHIMTYKCTIYPHYQPGEVVAVAQSGKEIYNQLQQRYGNTSDAALGFMEMYKGLAMWRNKMFVPADLCPNKICITDIKVERLQGISDEDCLKEGIIKNWGYRFDTPLGECVRSNPRDAFACLIDCVSGKGTWESNPWVFAYTFVLVD